MEQLDGYLPLILHETKPLPHHWRSGLMRFLWHYRLWFAVSACLWLLGGFIVYLAAL